MNRNIKTSLILSIGLLSIVRLYPVWERNPGGFWNFIFYISIAILFIWLVIKVVRETITLVKKRKTLNFKMFIPLLVMSIALLDLSFNPLNVDLERSYGKVIFRACYEGTQNQATFNLRENGKFDIHWTGVFFYDEFFTGNYTKHRDTILMNFDNEIPRMLGDTLIIKDENLYRLKSDTLISTHFYLGYCKGLN